MHDAGIPWNVKWCVFTCAHKMSLKNQHERERQQKKNEHSHPKWSQTVVIVMLLVVSSSLTRTHLLRLAPSPREPSFYLYLRNSKAKPNALKCSKRKLNKQLVRKYTTIRFSTNKMAKHKQKTNKTSTMNCSVQSVRAARSSKVIIIQRNSRFGCVYLVFGCKSCIHAYVCRVCVCASMHCC